MPNDMPPLPQDAIGERRPHRNLLTYYFLQSLVLGPFFPVLFVPRLFKYRSLRYHLAEDGVAAEWGVLFRHEVSLGYARIQDIHLASNVVERWLGIARIQVQTASGSSTAELTIEGLPDYAEVRDWIYSRMRGASARHRPARAASTIATPSPQVGESLAETPAPAHHAADPAETAAPGETFSADAIAAALREVAAELRRVRELLEGGRADGKRGSPR